LWSTWFTFCSKVTSSRQTQSPERIDAEIRFQQTVQVPFSAAGQGPGGDDMFWRRRKPGWFIDPSNVTFGSVVEDKTRNLSRSHVRVKYHRDPAIRFVPLATFFRSCHESTRTGRSLDVEHLLVAPILKRRHEKFFDRLTDWGPATRRAGRPQTDH